MSAKENKEKEIESLAYTVKFLILEADENKLGGEGFEKEAHKVFAQLMDKIKEPLYNDIRRNINQRNWVGLVEADAVFNQTYLEVYKSLRRYHTDNFTGWCIQRARWIILNEFKRVRISPRVTTIDLDHLNYDDKETFRNKIIKEKYLNAIRGEYEEWGKRQEIRDFLEALQAHYFHKGEEFLFKILALRGKFLDEEPQKVIGRDLKNKIPFKRIAYELGEFHADSNDKEIKAAQERVRKWYHKAVKIAEEFTSNYYKPLPMN